MRTRMKIERDCELASGTCFDISDSEIAAAQARLSQDIPDMLGEIALLKHTGDLAEEALGFKNAAIAEKDAEIERSRTMLKTVSNITIAMRKEKEALESILVAHGMLAP